MCGNFLRGFSGVLEDLSNKVRGIGTYPQLRKGQVTEDMIFLSQF